jgi:hypothetical protein
MYTVKWQTTIFTVAQNFSLHRLPQNRVPLDAKRLIAKNHTPKPSLPIIGNNILD